MTIFERIKTMSIEEMAVLLDNFEEIVELICNSRHCPVAGKEDGLCSSEDKAKYCHQATINFLKSEAEK